MAMLYTDPRVSEGCRKREAPISYDDRGPDSVECAPRELGGDAKHTTCPLDFPMMGTFSYGRLYAFVCGCQCHDPEPDE